MSLKNKTCLVYDRGAFFPFAQALSGENGFKTVYYFSTNSGFMSKSQEALIGRGFEGIERVDSFWSYVDDADVICFADVGDGDLIHYLKEKNYPVWGSDRAEMLELDRYQFRKLLDELGQPTPDTTRVEGIDALRKELRHREDCYIKTGFFRNDFETHHFQSYAIDKPWIDELELRIGPHAKEIEIIIEEPVKGIEPGWDGYSINGQFPNGCMWGYELKDKAYLGKADDFATMPEALKSSCLALASPLRELGLQGNFHLEIRVGEQTYILDPATRCGSPPIEAMACMIENWAEIVYGGAHGELIEPEFAGKYGCQLILKSMWSLENFLSVDVPKELEPYLKLRRGTKFKNDFFCVPAEELELFGSACGVGETPEEALEMAKTVAEAVEALELEYAEEADDELLELAEQGADVLGQEF